MKRNCDCLEIIDLYHKSIARYKAEQTEHLIKNAEIAIANFKRRHARHS